MFQIIKNCDEVDYISKKEYKTLLNALTSFGSVSGALSEEVLDEMWKRICFLNNNNGYNFNNEVVMNNENNNSNNNNNNDYNNCEDNKANNNDDRNSHNNINNIENIKYDLFCKLISISDLHSLMTIDF
jgi:hypothetical protein